MTQLLLLLKHIAYSMIPNKRSVSGLKYAFFSIILFPTLFYAQTVHLDTFKLKNSEYYSDIQSDRMNFPVIRTGHSTIDSIINTDLKNRYTNNEYPNESLDSALLKWAGDGVVYLDFEVTYNQNNLLSFNITAEGCGAYCTAWTEYFNYSIVNGKSLVLSDVLEVNESFKNMVFGDKDLQYKSQIGQLFKGMDDEESDLDADSFEMIMEYYLKCQNDFELEFFSLYPDHLEIIEECWLPHILLPFTPNIELKYEYNRIKSLLKLNI
ncbi:MAG: hypothetical protein KJ941_10255 [Bacteroidetes bacterium]|nr:hypothetical protein [Bacteroidota bacterium]